MKIEIDNKEYLLKDEQIMAILDKLEFIGFTFLEKLPMAAHMLFTSYARKELYDHEQADKEHKERYRPGKREDPIKHLVKIMKEDTKFPDMRLESNDNGEIISLGFKDPGEVGRSMVARGDER